MDRDHFPFGTDDPAPTAKSMDNPTQRGLLRYLRQHGYYLTPGNGITIFSLLAVVLRGTLLNLLVWIPAIVLFFVFGLWASEQISDGLAGDAAGPVPPPVLMILPRLLSALESEPCGTSTPAGEACAGPEEVAIFSNVRERLPELLGFELFLDIAVVITLALTLGTLIYSLLTWLRRGRTKTMFCFWYDTRRFTDRLVAILIPVTLVTLIIGTLPLVGVYLEGWTASAAPLAVLTGIGVTLRQFFSSGLSEEGKLNRFLVTLGAGLFLYGVFLVAYEIAFRIYPAYMARGWAWLALVAWVGVFGWFVNLNYISVHRFYRDRLMETFMPDIPRALKNKTGKAVGADAATLQQVGDPDDPRGPYLIVNTNVILVDSKEPVYRQRGGDNFILTPLYCGSNATGWRRSDQFMGGKMTLSTAVAISGAALNPSSGVGGEGLTRDRFLSLVMYLLNLRLGYWACHPDPNRQPRHNANHFLPGLYTFGNALRMPRAGFAEDHSFLQISDGGQFENMAVYELVRRRLGLIIVCDGGADRDFTFSDFQTTVRRIESDFGARIKVHRDASPDQMIPLVTDDAYPKGTGFSRHGYMVCTIYYAGGETGILLFLKSALIEKVSFQVKGYAAQHPDFPDQSTVDQFFDEVQFESYRELGYRLAIQMLDDNVPAGIGPETLPPGAKLRDLIDGYCAS